MGKRKSARQIWLALHLYVGLFLGGVFSLLGLSGSALVFYLEIDRTLNPETSIRQVASQPPPVQAVLQAITAHYPQRTGPWRIEMPLTANTPFMARYYNPPETRGRMFSPLMLTIDPQTLAVTSSRFWGDYAVTWLFDLHYTLLLEGDGQTAVGVLGLLMAASLLSGLYLWWPSVARFWRAIRPAVRSGTVLRTYDLHVLAGVYGCLVLLVLALTGSALALPNATKRLLVLFSQPSPALQAMKGLVPAGAVVLNLDQAIQVANARFPAAQLRWIETPGEAGKPIALRLHQPGEPGTRFPRTHVWVHPVQGTILQVQDGMHNTGADTFLAWIHPLHNGEAFGLAGRFLACVAGLLPALLFITGWLRWRQKSRAKNRTEMRRRR